MNEIEKLNYNLTHMITYAILVLGLCSLMGCSGTKCVPQVKLDGTYIGIKCGGTW